MSALRRAGIVVLFAALAVEVHELGHRAVFSLTGTRRGWAFSGSTRRSPSPTRSGCGERQVGPLVTLLLSAVLVAVARRHRTFVWATAAFTQASLRLFPLAFDLVRAARGAAPFSDEGELALAVSTPIPVRVALVFVASAAFGALMVPGADRPTGGRHSPAPGSCSSA